MVLDAMTYNKKASPVRDKWIKRSDVAQYLGIGWRVVERLLREGKIKTVRDPLDHRRKMVSAEDLDRLKQMSSRDE
jgi:predicted site-specific integrase-resolvase